MPGWGFHNTGRRDWLATTSTAAATRGTPPGPGSHPGTAATALRSGCVAASAVYATRTNRWRARWLDRVSLTRAMRVNSRPGESVPRAGVATIGAATPGPVTRSTGTHENIAFTRGTSSGDASMSSSTDSTAHRAGHSSGRGLRVVHPAAPTDEPLTTLPPVPRARVLARLCAGLLSRMSPASGRRDAVDTMGARPDATSDRRGACSRPAPSHRTGPSTSPPSEDPGVSRTMSAVRSTGRSVDRDAPCIRWPRTSWPTSSTSSEGRGSCASMAGAAARVPWACSCLCRRVLRSMLEQASSWCHASDTSDGSPSTSITAARVWWGTTANRRSSDRASSAVATSLGRHRCMESTRRCTSGWCVHPGTDSAVIAALSSTRTAAVLSAVDTAARLYRKRATLAHRQGFAPAPTPSPSTPPSSPPSPPPPPGASTSSVGFAGDGRGNSTTLQLYTRRRGRVPEATP